jgi:hypothetical protein
MDANSTVWTLNLMSFCGNSPKSLQNGEKFVKKGVKKSKNSPFFVR